MKAVRFSQFGGPEVLQIVELPDPRPGPGQVRIAVRAAGVNPSDWKKRQGLMDPELPQTLGYEAAGIVDELGEGVRTWRSVIESSASPLTERPRPSWLCWPTTRRSRRRSTSLARPHCRPRSRRPRVRSTSSASGTAARC